MKQVALALTVLTGFTGLVYEVTWQKALSTLLGSHSEATAAVLGIFLGGLSVGYALFGRITLARVARARAAGERPHLLRLYGLVEAAIGLHALAFPWLFRGAQHVSLRLPLADSPAGFAFDVGLAALLIGPPTVLMGGTIPILTQALSRSLADATRVHAHVYAFNTVGAFAGALAAGFVLIPWLGIGGVLATMALVNLSAGAGFLLLGARGAGGRPGAAPEPSGPATGTVAGFGVYAFAALLLGFAMMATQTVLIRLGGLALGASHFTFSMVVAVFVLCIALGSLGVAALPRVPRLALPTTVWALAACFALLFLVADDAPYWAHWLRTRFGDDPADFYRYHLSAFAGLLLVIGLPVGLSGASLPLLFDHLRHEVGDLGAIAGRLYSWNTVGNLLGAILGGYVLLLWVDLHHVYRIALLAITLAAALVSMRVAGARWPATVGSFALAAALVAVLPSWEPHRLASGLFRMRTPIAGTAFGADRVFSLLPNTIEFYTDDPIASVAVKRSIEHGRSHRSIISNGKSDGSTGSDYTTASLVGLLPCLLAERCERAFVIGYGTGVSAGELARLESMEKVVVAEISPGVIEAAPFFDFANGRASESPKVEIVASDAYRALLRDTGRYDVILSEPSNPWVTGVEMLFSREFLEAARSRLRPGGVYSQWFHLYETDRETVEMVLRSYLSVFGDASLWFTKGPDLLLLGFESGTPQVDLERLAERFQQPDYAAALRRVDIHSVPELLVHELVPAGVLPELGLSGPVHTLMHPRLAHVAARAFFRGQMARPPSAAAARSHVAESSLLARHLAAHPDALDEDAERMELVRELCANSRSEECGSGLGWWQSRAPDSPELAELKRRVLDDESADLAGVVERLHGFYVPRRGEPLSAEETLRAARLYLAHFTAPLPFHEDAWSLLWERCRGANGECEAARREALQEEWGALPGAKPGS